MCLQFDPFNGEGDDIELVLPGDLLDRVANAFRSSHLDRPSSSSCVTTSTSESSSKHLQQFYIGSPKPETFHSIEILMEENNINSNPIAQEASILVDNKVINTTLLKLYKTISNKIKVIGEKSEGFKDELLITLVGVTGQNAMQMPWSSSASSSGLKYVAMAANCMAFISLLSGVLLRSKAAIEGQARKRVASNMLVMLGILLTAAGPMFNISMNIPGVGRYFVPLICLLLVSITDVKMLN